MYVLDFLNINNRKVKRIIEEEMESTMNNFITSFVDKNLIKERILLWNCLNKDYTNSIKRFSINEINKVYVPNKDNLFIYLEREKELFNGSFDVICNFFEQQEPWEETDVTVFDNKFKWMIACTHEDEVITLGLY